MCHELKKISLGEFLEYKTLYYDKIDFSYVKKAWYLLEQKIKMPYVIHIVGTNGKGTTGRFLATYLYRKKYRVLHYSSPHIINFNERIWKNGSDIDDKSLQKAHEFLQDIFDIELLKVLTYFEYTTLLALYLSKDIDYLVLEAGLGGEFDATNVVKNQLSLITTIGLDHQEFLGDTIEKIATTKMRSCDTKMIIGYQENKEVLDYAKEVQKQKSIELKVVEDFDKYKFDDSFPLYLKRNLALVTACLEELGVDIDTSYFTNIKLFGRCEKIASNITIDVGHNPLAANALLKEFENEKVVLVYNSFFNKDYKTVLKILKPIIKAVYIIEIDDKRVEKKDTLSNILEELNIINYKSLEIKNDENYLVFGSFLVVERFLSLIGFNEK
ncbi:MAG: bifunctional folylpolyglutamate synthase/dihydrofolate synthase [Campylobacterota bacterium]